MQYVNIVFLFFLFHFPIVFFFSLYVSERETKHKAKELAVVCLDAWLTFDLFIKHSNKTM